MISKRDLEAAVASEIDSYRGNIDESMAAIIIERNRLGKERGRWSSEWSAAMSGGGITRYEAEVRRQCAEILAADHD